MLRTRNIVLSALVVGGPLLAVTLAPAEDVVFAPKEGASVTKTFTSEFEMTLEDMTMLMDGEENPMMPSMEMDITASSEIAVTDTYGAVSDGQPAKVSRSFDTIGQDIEIDMTVEAMGESEEINQTGTGSSQLEGKTVVYTLGDDGEYAVAWPEDEDGDSDLLENLEEDMDLRCLLPTEAVSEGDTYEIALEGLIDILAPGGDLHWEVEMDGVDAADMEGPDPAMMADMRTMMGDMLDGKAEGKFTGTRDIDGAKIGVIELDITIDAAGDMSSFIEEMMGEQIPEEVDMTLDRVDLQFAFEGEGELLWNLDAGHVHSLTLGGETAMQLDVEMSVDFGGQGLTIEVSVEASGELNQEVSTD